MRFLGVLIAVLIHSSVAFAEAPPPILTVTGEGRVLAEPDMATITLGVTSQAKTARTAMDETSRKVSRILAALTAAGIEGRDLQTRNLSLSPIWSNRSYDTDGARRITGFTASNTIMVRARGLDGLGGILDTVLENGGNTFQGLSFGLQDPGPAQDEARVKAVKEAMRKAKLYAQAAGIELGAVVSLSETGGGVPRPVMMEAARMSSDVPIAGGEVSVSSSVTMQFSIGG